MLVVRARWAVAAAGQAAGLWAEALLRLGFLVLLGQAQKQKKSSMTKASQRGMIINYVRFSRAAAADGTGYPVSFITGQVMTIEKQIIIT
ncbi:hypothetical protein U3A58_01735 [Algoriphagus sp. C2-6-M1]|uniref:hypothetical protein n=1 Tax=Algoriphagus persicinus TaxID=3108754 RepID=UPI002B3D7F60|nr:hypothetical protein [Algoriphagus sp. C2-6-M1]MEB2779097.1 hypothetical protein [Algoriphagus sp. C2-6-M1]